MRTAAPRTGQDQVERKANQLLGCATAQGLSLTQLRLGAAEAQRQNLPLRDAIVLREAQRFMVTRDVLRAWIGVRKRCRAALREHVGSYAIWIKPVRPVGTNGSALLVTAPAGIRTWLERRYSHLIREALQATGSGYTEVEFVSAGEGM